MNPFSLENKTILVTGASSGIGRQCAICISRMKGTVVITGRNKKELQQTMKLLQGKRHRMIQADLTSQKDISELADKCTVLNGAVHCAGLAEPFPCKFLNEETLEQSLRINFKAPVLITSGLLQQRKMAEKASLVFLSSISVSFPARGLAAYSSSKAALEAYSKTLALEMADKKIRSNVIAPAMIETGQYEYYKTFASSKRIGNTEKRHLLGPGEPDDVANAAIFLLSDASKWLTGQTISLDGGYGLAATNS